MTVDRIIKVLDSYVPNLYPAFAASGDSLGELVFRSYKAEGRTTVESSRFTMQYLKLVAEKLHTEIEQQKSVPFAVNTAGRIPE